ncbi:ROK family protein [Georgenia sp. SYP-B2076]|uniref:ROK family protein n=1 Tax=Georgenia sp. SYP-B2076 TaxID=2495881 RepID=UPI000F8D2428|nr:ROK family protein [Georgenia sp. SYP-B2076]
MAVLAPAVVPEKLNTLTAVLDLIRDGRASTRPGVARLSGLGRTATTQRLTQLIEARLIEEGPLGASTGGRAPRELRFRSHAGNLLVAELGATTLNIGLSDLEGRLLAQRQEQIDVSDGPDATLAHVEGVFDDMIAARPSDAPPVWGIGIGLPGPVEFATGRPVAPPIMPGWDGYAVRDRLAARYDVPVWVDNDVNLMALGEFRGGLADSERDIVFLKVGTGIGAGLISGGRLHRGAQGSAGDVGHVAMTDDASVICRCGNVGCLEALAGGFALVRDATAAAHEGRSPILARLAQPGGRLSVADVAVAAEHGDPVSVELLTRAGQQIGRMLAALVNFFNPSLIIVGGAVTGGTAGDLVLAAIRQTIYGRSLPLATRELRIAHSPLSNNAGLTGAAFMAIDELFEPECLARWIDAGAPTGRPDVVLSGVLE